MKFRRNSYYSARNNEERSEDRGSVLFAAGLGALAVSGFSFLVEEVLHVPILDLITPVSAVTGVALLGSGLVALGNARTEK